MLNIAQRTTNSGATVLEIQGRITLGRDAQELQWKLDELLGGNTKRLIMDLAGVNVLDSTGIGIIVMGAGKLKETGGSMRIAGAAGMVAHTLQLCRVADIVPMFDSVEAASVSFGQAAGQA